MADLDEAGPHESDDDGDHVDGELELQELGDAVVDVTSPHHSLNDRRKVIVRQDDVRRLLRYVRTRDTLSTRTIHEAGVAPRDEPRNTPALYRRKGRCHPSMVESP